MDWPLILTAGGGILVGLIPTLGKYLLDRRKQLAELRLAESDQPIEQYKDIVEGMEARNKKEVERLDSRVAALEAGNAECLKRYAEQQLEMGRLTGRLDAQDAAINHLRATTTKQAVELVKSAGETAALGVQVAGEVVAQGVKAATDAAKVESAISNGIDNDHPLPVKVVGQAKPVEVTETEKK